jgi:putative lysine transport system permease protein
MNLGNDIVYLLKNYFQYYLIGLASTCILSLVGTVVGLLLGMFLGLGKNINVLPSDPWYIKAYKYPIKVLSTIYSTVIRGTPMMVQALIFKYGCQAMGVNWNAILPGVPVFDGWMVAGLIVITLNTTAYMGEIIRSGLNGVDKGEIEGARSLGMTPLQTMWYVALPQAIRNSLPTIGNEWIVNIKDSSVLNVIGLTELYFQAEVAVNKNYKFMASYIIIAVIYLSMTLIASGILKLLEYKMDGKKIKFSFFHFRKAGA